MRKGIHGLVWVGVIAACGSEAPISVDETSASLIEHDEDWDWIDFHTRTNDPAYNRFAPMDTRNAVDAASAVALVIAGGFRCTGFLVDYNLVATAEHCLYDDNGNVLSGPRVFQFFPEATNPLSFTCNQQVHVDPRADVVTFRCAPDASMRLPGDYIAPLQLSRVAPRINDTMFQIGVNCRCDEWSLGCEESNPTGPNVRLRDGGQCVGSPAGGNRLYRLMSPGGLGQTQSRFENCDVSNADAEWRRGRHGFNINCDSLEGSSGSPVFDRMTGEVRGIISAWQHQFGSFNGAGEFWRFLRDNDIDADRRLDSEEPGPLAWQSQSPTDWMAVERCRFVKARVTGSARDDLVCVYDYGNSMTATFAQIRSTTQDSFGSYQSFSPFQSGFSVSLCKTIEVADIDRDGFDDLICPYDYGTTTRTFVQRGGPFGFTNWHLRGQTGFQSLDLDQCRALEVADVNSDGYSDLVCVRDFGGASTQTYVQLNFATGWSNWGVYAPYHSGTFNPNLCRTIEVADVNGDGRVDLVCPYDYGSHHRTFVQYGGFFGFGSWTVASPTTNQWFLGDCRLLEIIDYDGNQTPDLLCVAETVHGNTYAYVQRGNSFSFGAWEPAGTTPTDLDLDACHQLGAADLNGNGLDDVYCVHDVVTVARFNLGGVLAPWDVASGTSLLAFMNPANCGAILEMQLDADNADELACPLDLGWTAYTAVLR